MYKEAIVSEAVRAEPIVNELKARVEEFLLEWPDHPGLVQVSIIHTHIPLISLVHMYTDKEVL